MKVLLLGAYGFIGRDVARTLTRAGFEVKGLGRSARTAGRLVPGIAWASADIATLRQPRDWFPFLSGIDAVVNASGVLQDGARDRVDATQADAIQALISACENLGVPRFVQISAPDARMDATSAFLRSKAIADAALRSSALTWVILRPGLVIGANAQGGSAFLRALAAFPAVQPMVLAGQKVFTVALQEVADAVRDVLLDHVPVKRTYDLVEPMGGTLADVVLSLRGFMGFPAPRALIHLPGVSGTVIAKLGDLAGWLGWRPPLRTTALRVLAEGVVGDPTAWRDAGGRPPAPLAETLNTLSATAQDRLFARAMLIFPLLVVMLAGFWVASGVIGFWRWPEAAAVVKAVMPPLLARISVWAGASIDIAIGLGVLWRPTTRRAAWGSIVVALGYLGLGSILTPLLWADPLGPFVKVIPAIGLALAVLASAEDR
jgi:uncharacterized protein YbjT (DUF2867 family)